MTIEKKESYELSKLIGIAVGIVTIIAATSKVCFILGDLKISIRALEYKMDDYKCRTEKIENKTDKIENKINEIQTKINNFEIFFFDKNKKNENGATTETRR